MPDTPRTTAQPGEKPAYVPPRVMRLGDLNEGAGACTAGSGVVSTDCTPSGAAANSGSCLVGNQAAAGTCDSGNYAAAGSCNMSGGTAHLGCTTGTSPT
jgi:hypothetical protein